MAEVLFRARLQRTDSSVPWGFRLQGGEDFGIPLTLLKVQEGSVAEQGGLQAGDILVRLGGLSAEAMTHRDAQIAIQGSKDLLEIIVERAEEKAISPSTKDDASPPMYKRQHGDIQVIPKDPPSYSEAISSPPMSLSQASIASFHHTPNTSSGFPKLYRTPTTPPVTASSSIDVVHSYESTLRDVYDSSSSSEDDYAESVIDVDSGSSSINHSNSTIDTSTLSSGNQAIPSTFEIQTNASPYNRSIHSLENQLSPGYQLAISADNQHTSCDIHTFTSPEIIPISESQLPASSEHQPEIIPGEESPVQKLVRPSENQSMTALDDQTVLSPEHQPVSPPIHLTDSLSIRLEQSPVTQSVPQSSNVSILPNRHTHVQGSEPFQINVDSIQGSPLNNLPFTTHNISQGLQDDTSNEPLVVHLQGDDDEVPALKHSPSFQTEDSTAETNVSSTEIQITSSSSQLSSKTSIEFIPPSPTKAKKDLYTDDSSPLIFYQRGYFAKPLEISDVTENLESTTIEAWDKDVEIGSPIEISSERVIEDPALLSGVDPKLTQSDPGVLEVSNPNPVATSESMITASTDRRTVIQDNAPISLPGGMSTENQTSFNEQKYPMRVYQVENHPEMIELHGVPLDSTIPHNPIPTTGPGDEKTQPLVEENPLETVPRETGGVINHCDTQSDKEAEDSQGLSTASGKSATGSSCLLNKEKIPNACTIDTTDNQTTMELSRLQRSEIITSSSGATQPITDLDKIAPVRILSDELVLSSPKTIGGLNDETVSGSSNLGQTGDVKPTADVSKDEQDNVILETNRSSSDNLILGNRQVSDILKTPYHSSTLPSSNRDSNSVVNSKTVDSSLFPPMNNVGDQPESMSTYSEFSETVALVSESETFQLESTNKSSVKMAVLNTDDANVFPPSITETTPSQQGKNDSSKPDTALAGEIPRLSKIVNNLNLPELKTYSERSSSTSDKTSTTSKANSAKITGLEKPPPLPAPPETPILRKVQKDERSEIKSKEDPQKYLTRTDVTSWKTKRQSSLDSALPDIPEERQLATSFLKTNGRPRTQNSVPWRKSRSRDGLTVEALEEHDKKTSIDNDRARTRALDRRSDDGSKSDSELYPWRKRRSSGDGKRVQTASSTGDLDAVKRAAIRDRKGNDLSQSRQVAPPIDLTKHEPLKPSLQLVGKKIDALAISTLPSVIARSIPALVSKQAPHANVNILSPNVPVISVSSDGSGQYSGTITPEDGSRYSASPDIDDVPIDDLRRRLEAIVVQHPTLAEYSRESSVSSSYISTESSSRASDDSDSEVYVNNLPEDIDVLREKLRWLEEMESRYHRMYYRPPSPPISPSSDSSSLSDKDKSRRVRFADPPAQSVIEIEARPERNHPALRHVLASPGFVNFTPDERRRIVGMTPSRFPFELASHRRYSIDPAELNLYNNRERMLLPGHIPRVVEGDYDTGSIYQSRQQYPTDHGLGFTSPPSYEESIRNRYGQRAVEELSAVPEASLLKDRLAQLMMMQRQNNPHEQYRHHPAEKPTQLDQRQEQKPYSGMLSPPPGQAAHRSPSPSDETLQTQTIRTLEAMFRERAAMSSSPVSVEVLGNPKQVLQPPSKPAQQDSTNIARPSNRHLLPPMAPHQVSPRSASPTGHLSPLQVSPMNLSPRSVSPQRPSSPLSSALGSPMHPSSHYAQGFPTTIYQQRQQSAPQQFSGPGSISAHVLSRRSSGGGVYAYLDKSFQDKLLHMQKQVPRKVPFESETYKLVQEMDQNKLLFERGGLLGVNNPQSMGGLPQDSMTPQMQRSSQMSAMRLQSQRLRSNLENMRLDRGSSLPPGGPSYLPDASRAPVMHRQTYGQQLPMKNVGANLPPRQERNLRPQTLIDRGQFISGPNLKFPPSRGGSLPPEGRGVPFVHGFDSRIPGQTRSKPPLPISTPAKLGLESTAQIYDNRTRNELRTTEL